MSNFLMQPTASEAAHHSCLMGRSSSFVLPADAQSCLDSKQLAARMEELQERQRSLQALLDSRLRELRWVCLLEAVSVRSAHVSVSVA